ncbi:hypothetical protein J6590_003451 [Homalodisca vitripennis]|nr:hypothetical protein J6590_003451 [Homalodisca vitripennis]
MCVFLKKSIAFHQSLISHITSNTSALSPTSAGAEHGAVSYSGMLVSYNKLRQYTCYVSDLLLAILTLRLIESSACNCSKVYNRLATTVS